MKFSSGARRGVGANETPQAREHQLPPGHTLVEEQIVAQDYR